MYLFININVSMYLSMYFQFDVIIRNSKDAIFFPTNEEVDCFKFNENATEIKTPYVYVFRIVFQIFNKRILKISH